eukprot:gene19618-26302_t
MTKNTELNRDLIITSLSQFYASSNNINQMHKITEGNCQVSLRLIDWFVTNYCKKYNVEIIRSKNNIYNIYVDYRAQLKAFSKHNFDPFRRRDRIKYFFSNELFILTTVGQLNFFKWAIENGVVDYIRCNMTNIENDMTASYKTNYVAKKHALSEPDRKKRNEISKSCLKQVNIVPAARMLTFATAGQASGFFGGEVAPAPALAPMRVLSRSSLSSSTASPVKIAWGESKKEEPKGEYSSASTVISKSRLKFLTDKVEPIATRSDRLIILYQGRKAAGKNVETTVVNGKEEHALVAYKTVIADTVASDSNAMMNSLIKQQSSGGFVQFHFMKDGHEVKKCADASLPVVLTDTLALKKGGVVVVKVTGRDGSLQYRSFGQRTNTMVVMTHIAMILTDAVKAEVISLRNTDVVEWRDFINKAKGAVKSAFAGMFARKTHDKDLQMMQMQMQMLQMQLQMAEAAKGNGNGNRRGKGRGRK